MGLKDPRHLEKGLRRTRIAGCPKSRRPGFTRSLVTGKLGHALPVKNHNQLKRRLSRTREGSLVEGGVLGGDGGAGEQTGQDDVDGERQAGRDVAVSNLQQVIHSISDQSLPRRHSGLPARVRGGSDGCAGLLSPAADYWTESMLVTTRGLAK
jgi:hypothetical protein